MFEIGTVFTQEREWLLLALAASGKKKGKQALTDALAVLSEKLGVEISYCRRGFGG